MGLGWSGVFSSWRVAAEGGHAEVDGAGVRARRSIWASLSSAPARLILRPSTSPSQPSRSASAMRAVRLSRISAMRSRWAGSGQCRGHRRQLCSWMQGVPNARPQVPVATLRRSKWPRNSFPFGVGGGAVFLGGPQCAAAGEEGQVGLDGFVGVDGLVAEGDVDVAVPGDDLGDVRREPVHDRVGEEHPAEVVRGVVQRGAAGAGQAGAGQGGGEDLADGGGGDGAVLGADAPLEQHRGGRQPEAFVVVVGGDEGHGAGWCRGPG